MSIDYANLRSLTTRNLITALVKDGFYLRSQKGSHQRYYHPDGRMVTVAFHGMGNTFRPKILKKMIENQAKWNEEDLKRLKLLK
jgi:predicted RNA binding protein YcfA (HicA-like mRNA interferase family)